VSNWIDRCHFGDCRDTMRAMIADGVKVQTIVTSPPYYGLRDYGHPGQLGLEETPGAYIAAMVEVFQVARELIADDGTLWLNIGDTSNNRRKIRSTSHQPSLNGFSEPSWAELTKLGRTRLSINNGDLKEKDMMGIPWLLAFALRADGWYLRQEIIWSKSFGKPEPAIDRLPNRHEQMFLMSKSKRYKLDKTRLPEYAKNSVWEVPPVGISGHGASFSGKLIEPCVLAASDAGQTVLDPFFGSGTTGLIASQLGRRFIGCELNPEYEPLQRERLRQPGFELTA
jgi:DNA modification methylase